LNIYPKFRGGLESQGPSLGVSSEKELYASDLFRQEFKVIGNLLAVCVVQFRIVFSIFQECQSWLAPVVFGWSSLVYLFSLLCFLSCNPLASVIHCLGFHADFLQI
jgi:hypothetical protein